MSDTLDITQSPSKFLDPYTVEERNRFFGREEDIEELYERLHEGNLLLVYGASGTGKSSLLQCGLANRFSPSEWLPVWIRREEGEAPGEAETWPMLFSLQTELQATLKAEARKSGGRSMELVSSSLEQLIEQVYLLTFKPVYLHFDQFEEIFINGHFAEQKQFFEALDDLLQRGAPCKVVLSIREEYLAFLHDFELVIPSLFDNRQRIEKMNRSNLREVIAGTAAISHIELKTEASDGEKDFVDAMIDRLESRGEGVDLSNLQIYLDKLWREDRKRQTEEGLSRPVRFDTELLTRVGELEDILSEFLDDQLQTLEDDVQRAYPGVRRGLALEMLFSFITDEGTKRVLAVGGIKEQLQKRLPEASPELLDFILDRFAELKLIRVLPERSA